AKYAVRWTETEKQTTFALERVKLEKPYVKRYENTDDETLRHYRSVLEQGFSIGAYAENVLMGLAIAETERWNATLRVWEFHVSDRWRRQGVGRTLMAALAEKSRSANLRVMMCETQTTNVPAIGFYRKMGFKLEGIDLSYYTNDDWPEGE